MTWVKRLLGRPSKVGPADPVEPDYYQRIGAAIAAVVAGEFDKALGHFEVEEDTINGDVIFLRDGRLAFRFGSPELNDLVHEFWEY
ncbi:MAG: hypothetical protein K0R83_2241, partial [Caulobacter sp.]|nr:hypothetical protein [Caulobacter sp.]